MRIGIDARLWNETGVGRYIRNLTWNLQEIDKKNTYVLFVNNNFKKQELNIKNNWKIVETGIRWHSVEEQLQLPKILEKEQLDLVHFPYFSVPIYYKFPFVITIHDLIINHYPTGKASTLPTPFYYVKLFGYKYVIRQAAVKARKVITVSEATKKEIVEHLDIPKEKIIVTYEGVEDIKLGKLQSSKFKLHDKKFFLYVGNAYPHKNLERLVKSFALVVKEFSDMQLVLVGQKNYFYNQLENVITNLHIEKNVIFTGNLDDDNLHWLYKHANALILPSLMEGFGLPGLEAMREGCLVVASDIPSFREIYQNAAVYFNPLDVESLHATIREVLTDNKKFLTVVDEGKKRVTFFSWKKMAEQTLNIYESCLSIRSD